MKKVIILISVLLLTMGAGVTVTLLMNDNGSSTKKDPQETSSEPVSSKNMNLATSKNPQDAAGTPAGEGNNDARIQNTPKISPKPAVPHDTPKSESGNTVPTKKGPATNVNGNSSNWVEMKIQKHKDEIDPQDLEDFRRIFPRIDQGYIQSLTVDGLTSDETDELKVYLGRTLGGDYERAKELFYRYNYLLSDD